MHPFFALVRRFGRDEGGVFAVVFGLMAIVLIALGGAVVDYVGVEQARSRSQIALDAAALALQPEIFNPALTRQQIQDRAQALMVNRIGDDSIAAKITSTVIDIKTGSLYFSAEMEVPTIFVGLVGVPSLRASIQSEVRRGSMDVEVSVAIDITGSMLEMIPGGNGRPAQSKMAALETALGELIDLVVKDEQKPSYSKMAIVPYSMGVNVGDYAETIRGPIKQPTNISNVTWAAGNAVTIEGATKANPVVITSKKHGFTDGQTVFITGVKGMTQINDLSFTVAGAKTDTFQLKGINGERYSTHSGSSGSATPCLTGNCELVVTSSGHGLKAGDNAYIAGVTGQNSSAMRTYGSASPEYKRFDNSPTFDNANYVWINNNKNGEGDYRFLVWKIGATTGDSFVLPGTSRVKKDYGVYRSGGTAACVAAGCEYYLFQNRNSNSSSWRRHQVSTCVTERSPNAFNDVPPTTTLLGRNYPSAGNPCLRTTILPLTDDKTALHGLASNLKGEGSTAGQLGLAWGWYMISPSFNGPWPDKSQPAPASEKNVVRAVVLMTDGDFNTSYCNGVISQQSGSGSGDDNSKINCNSPNGTAFTQAKALCAAMKQADPPIRIYTVAFDTAGLYAAQEIMDTCASEPEYAFKATTGADLSDVFEKIGENLAYLRITQ